MKLTYIFDKNQLQSHSSFKSLTAVGIYSAENHFLGICVKTAGQSAENHRKSVTDTDYAYVML